MSGDNNNGVAEQILSELDSLRAIVGGVIYSATRTMMVVRFGRASARNRCVKITNAIVKNFNMGECANFLNNYVSDWTADNKVDLDEDTLSSYWSWGTHMCIADVYDKHAAGLKNDRVLRGAKAGKEVAIAIGAVTHFMGPRVPKPLVVFPSLCELDGIEDLIESHSGRFTEYLSWTPP